MKKINIGIIGYGYMGKMHSMCYENLKYYYEIPDVKINLYAVVTSKKQEDLDTKFEKVYKTYQELLEDKNVDAVSMCLPNFMHKEVIMECLKMKKHIYCEKPLALNLKEGEEILEYMNEISYNKVNRMVFEYRFVLRL